MTAYRSLSFISPFFFSPSVPPLLHVCLFFTSLPFLFSLFASSFTSLSSSPLFRSFFFLFHFLSLLQKHLPSLWSRGWQDKKRVSIRQSRKGRIDSETKGGFAAVYEYMCVCVHACVWGFKYSYMHVLPSVLHTRVLQLEETENGVKLGWLHYHRTRLRFNQQNTASMKYVGWNS